MKYPKIKPSKPLAYLYDDFSCGVGAKNTTLQSVSNFYNANGKFATRNALESDIEGILHTTRGAQDAEFKLTDSTVFFNGEYHRVGIIESTDETSYVEYAFLFINHNSERIDAGSIKFWRASSNEFNRPRSVLVFTGKSTKGMGVYAFIEIEKADGSSYMKIYELDNNMSEWLEISPEETYVPDYYINGRGTMYRESEETYPNPQFKEAKNMLNPKYNCYFTSDGVSNAFVLPTKNMVFQENDSLSVDLSLPNGQKYSWKIKEGRLVSNEVEIGEYSVLVSLNAISGGISFVSRPGGYVPPRSEGLTNNLKVTIRIDDTSNQQKIAGMKKALWYGTGNSGTRLCVTGNDKYPSLVLISQKNMPLYFPDSNQFFVGDPAQSVTALARQNKSIIMFKEREIYSAYYTSGNFAITNIHSSVGCDLPETIALCDNRLVWTNLNGDVYMLSSLSQYSVTALYKLSNNIAQLLGNEPREKLKNACACTDNEKYLLFVKNKAYVMDYHKSIKKSSSGFLESLYWFVWDFSDAVDIKTAFSFDKGVALVCYAQSDKRICHYLSTISGAGDTDKYIVATENGEFEVASDTILSRIETILLDCNSPEQNKLFTDLYLRLFSKEDVHIDYQSVDGDILKSSVINIEYNGNKMPKAYRLLPLIRSPQLKIAITFRGETEFEGLVFYINKLSKMR